MRWILLLPGLLSALAAYAQTPAPSASPSPAATPYPLGAIVEQAAADSTKLAQIQADVDGDDFTDDLRKFLPGLTADINRHEDETLRALRTPAHLDTLRELEESWTVLRDDASLHSRLLNDKLKRLDEDSTKASNLTDLWTRTQTTAAAAHAPEDLMNRISGVLQQATAITKSLNVMRTKLLSLQSKLADQTTRITKSLASVQQARNYAMDRMFTRDSLPLWQAVGSASPKNSESRASLSTQASQTAAYLFQQRGTVLVQLAIWACLISLFRWAQRRVRRWVEADPALEGSTAILSIPIATASLLAVLLSWSLYPMAPPLLLAVLGALLLIPLTLVVRRIIEPPLLPVMWALALFYLASKIRQAAMGNPLIPRLIYLAEILGAIFFTLWLIKSMRFSGERRSSAPRKTIRAAAHAGLAIFAVAAVANVAGYVDFSLFIGMFALDTAYAAILLYAASHIADGLITFALNVPPLSLLAMVRHHRVLLERRMSLVIRWLAILAWVFFALETASLLDPVLQSFQFIFNLPLVAGVTLGSIVTFLLTIWASFLLSRFLRFLLEEDVYRRVRLKPGLPFAISTLLHYAILLFGFYLATAALVGNINKFTILAGAFGVGVGFGLQNIVNNFVSSLIVLFERPIKIGDYVNIGTAEGTVQSIGIRATIIRTDNGSEIIIPNGKLISDPVTNWTLSDHLRRIEIDVATAAPGVEPDRVIALLKDTAAALKEISASPPPEATMEKFGPAALNFKLRAWTSEVQRIDQVRSDLTVALNGALAKNGIASA